MHSKIFHHIKYSFGFFVFLSYFCVVLFLIAPDGFSTVYDVNGVKLVLDSSVNDIIAAFGSSDAGTYAKCGVIMFNGDSMYGVRCLPLFPPGMFVFYYLILSIGGINAGIYLWFAIVNSIIWAAAFYLAFVSIGVYMKRRFAFFIPLAFVFLPFAKDYFWSSTLLMSESLSIGLFICSQLFLFLSIVKARRRYSILFGSFIGIASLFRAQIYLVFLIQAAIVVAICAFVYLSNKLTDKSSYLSQIFSHSKSVLIGIVFASLAIVPYLTWNKYIVGEFRLFNADYYFKYPWMNDSEYTSVQSWILIGGGNIACHINPNQCASFANERLLNGLDSINFVRYKSAFTETLLFNPVSFLIEKLRIAPPYWFSSPSATTPAGTSKSWVGYMILSQIAFGFIFFIFRLRDFAKGDVFAINLIYFTSIVSNAVVFMGTHFEVRYFYLLFTSISFVFLLQFASLVNFARRIIIKSSRQNYV